MELHTFEDWIIERAYRSVPGVADDSGFGGPTMQYHVLLDPARLYNFHIPVAQVVNALAVEQRQHRRRLLFARRTVQLRARPRPAQIHRRYRRSRRRQQQRRAGARQGHRPRRDRPRAAPRHLRFQDKTKNNDDAVEGVILMRRGEQTQNVLQGVEQKTERTQPHRSSARRESPSLLRSQRSRSRHHRHRRRQSSSRHDARFRRADFLPRQRPRRRHLRAHHPARAALRLHLPARHRRSRQSALHRRHRFRHHHRRHHRDGRKHLPRTRPSATARTTICTKSCCTPRAMSIAPSSIPSPSSSPATCRSTRSPAQPESSSIPWPTPWRSRSSAPSFSLSPSSRCSLRTGSRNGVKEKQNRVFNWIRDRYAGRLGWCLDHPKLHAHRRGLDFRRHVAPGSRSSAANFCRTSTKARSGFAPPCPTPFRFEEAANFAPKIRKILNQLSAWSPSSAPNSAAPTTAPIPPASSIASFTSASNPTTTRPGVKAPSTPRTI